MTEKQIKETQQGNDNPLIYITLLLLGAVLICVISYYVPILIAFMLFISVAVLKKDMEQETPIGSIGLVIITAVFLIIAQVNSSLYYVLASVTGASAGLGYMVWKYFGVKTFETGITYSLMVSAIFGITAALVVFLLNDRQPFALEMATSLENWIKNSDSAFANQMLEMITATLYNMDEFGRVDYDASMNMMANGTGMTKIEQMQIAMPFFESLINRYSIYAMVLYPMFAGGVTYWRANRRFYKNEVQKDGEKTMKPMPFSTFVIPRRLLGATVLLILASFVIQSSGNDDMWAYAALLMQSFSFILLYMQGLAVMEYFLKRSNGFRKPWVRIAVMAFITIISMGVITSFLGIADLFLNIRANFKRAQEIKEKNMRR